MSAFKGNSKLVNARADLLPYCLIVLTLILNVGLAGLAQQATSKTLNDFAQPALLAQQGRAAEAKTATLEALEKHPSSVEGYNLLRHY